MRHADWTVEWPQSGERVRGHANDLAIMGNWPGGLPEAGEIRIVGSEDRWVMTPAFTIPASRGQRRFVVGGRDRNLSGRLPVVRRDAGRTP